MVVPGAPAQAKTYHPFKEQFMITIEVRLRQVGQDKAWEQISPNVTYTVDESKSTSYFVYRVIEAFYPALAVCEARWNIADSHKGHYFEYRRPH